MGDTLKVCQDSYYKNKMRRKLILNEDETMKQSDPMGDTLKVCQDSYYKNKMRRKLILNEDKTMKHQCEKVIRDGRWSY